MSKPLYLLTGSVAAIASPVIDYLSGWNLIPNPVYFLPIALFSWFTKRIAGLVIAALATLSFAAVHGSPVPRSSVGGTPMSGLLIQFSACIGIALTVDGVRRLIVTCRGRSVGEDLTLDTSAARAAMRAIDRDGRPRSRQSGDQR